MKGTQWINPALVFLMMVFVEQAVAQQKHIFGGQAGVNVAGVRPIGNVDFESNAYPGILVGLNYRFNITSGLQLKSGLLYTEKGLKTRKVDEQLGFSFDVKSRFQYLDVPLLGSYSFEVGRYTSIFIDMGLYGSLLLDGNIAYASFNNETTTGEPSELQPIDFGYQFGFGVEFMRFQLGTYFNIGLMKANVRTETYHVGVKNTALGFYLSYLFNKNG